MIVAFCRCGKQVLGSEAMAGEDAECPKCRARVTFPVPRRLAPAAALVPGDGPAADPEPTPEPPEPPRLPCEKLYWVLLVALLPLVSILFEGDRLDPRKRLEKTLEAHKELRPKVEELAASESATMDDLLRILPGQRLDGLAHLPRDSRRHWAYAGASAAAFFVLVGVWMAWRVAPAWQLVLAALFTASCGVATLLLMQDLLGRGYQVLLAEDRSFLANLLGFLVVGLTEELAKSLPVFFYLLNFRSRSWRGACLWGMASGVGFGIAEGVLYSREMYNGVAPGSAYLIRFASCVTLHAVWSASVGITLYGSRHLLPRVVGVFVYGDRATLAEAWGPVLSVLGVAMVLHGLYDTLLTQDLFLPALLVALLSFAWLGWQIEESREESQREARLREEMGVAEGSRRRGCSPGSAPLQPG